VHAESRAGQGLRACKPCLHSSGIAIPLRILGASLLLTAVDVAGEMSRGWERKKARLFEHYMALMIEQVASPLLFIRVYIP